MRGNAWPAPSTAPGEPGSAAGASTGGDALAHERGLQGGADAGDVDRVLRRLELGLGEEVHVLGEERDHDDLPERVVGSLRRAIQEIAPGTPAFTGDIVALPERRLPEGVRTPEPGPAVDLP